MAAAVVKGWTDELSIRGGDDLGAKWREALMQICDIAMPRTGQAPRPKAAYWWSAEIARLRDDCNRARRKLNHQRKKKRNANDRVAADLYSTWKEKKKDLQAAIRQVKNLA